MTATEEPRPAGLPTYPYPVQLGPGDDIAGRPPALSLIPHPTWARFSRRRAGRLAVWLPRTFLLSVDLGAYFAAAALMVGFGFKTWIMYSFIVALFWYGDLYRPRLSLSVLDDAPMILGRALTAGASSMILGGLDNGVAGFRRLTTAAVFAGLCLVARFAAYAVLRAGRRRIPALRQRALILGAGAIAGELAAQLLEHPQYGLVPEGLLDDDPLLPEGQRPVPVLAGYGDLTRVVLEHAADVVIVTFGSASEPSVVRLVRACDKLACEILFVPRLFELHAVTRGTEVLWGIPLVRLRRAAYRSGSWTVKRFSDIVLSALALTLVAPVMLVCAVLSRWETGSVLFRQTRIGLDGRPFTLLKFCSLRPAADSESATRWNIAGDQRLGPAGRLLRRTSLDELPQLWNVLRGEMSLVGPRPERPYFVDEFSRQFPGYPARHRVPAGLTGWAQIHGLRGDTSIGERARFDNFYIENWTLWGDIKILLRTALQVIRAGGR